MSGYRLTTDQLRRLLRTEGCDCTDKQWQRRGDHCSMRWIRCNGRWRWKKKNDPKFRAALESLK